MRRRLTLLLLAIGWSFLVRGLVEAREPPLVRRLTLEVAGLPAGTPPLRLLVMSDLHVAAPSMTPARLRQVVVQANALKPDAVLLLGDLVSDDRLDLRRYGDRQAVAPLAGLRVPLGVFAVLGNHDHWRGASGLARALAGAGVRLLSNDSWRLGSVTLVGVDDPYTHHDRLPVALAGAERLGGVPIVLAHSPDIFPRVPAAVPLVLAGHTHCGQVAPWPVGPIVVPSIYGRRYACGLIRERRHLLLVTAGLGTSDLPLRLGAPPDMWLVTIVPAQAAFASSAAVRPENSQSWNSLTGRFDSAERRQANQ